MPSPSPAANVQRGPLATAAAPQVNGATAQNGSHPGSTPDGTTSSNATPTMQAASPGLVYPALHLLPLNDTFVPKQISLSPVGTRIKIGRQTNAKTVPNATNGYFDSKVLSRMHAEVWCEDGKVFIKDVKSSNGTFINGDRLSPESAESDAFELHSEDVVEFGIDIVSDDNKTIVHHKVSTKVHVAVTAEEATTLMKNLPALYRMHDASLHRRPSKTGLTFDHVFARLQTELHKSRETGGELGGLTTTMAEIHDTLGGGVPPPLPTFPQPSRATQTTSVSRISQSDPQAFAMLQAQLSDTQATLAGHADKVRSLESLFLEHDSMKIEVGMLREQLDDAKKELGPQGGAPRPWPSGPDDYVTPEDEDTDAKSIASSDTTGAGSPASSTYLSKPRKNPFVRAVSDTDTDLLARLDALTRELRELSQLNQTLLLQQEAAHNAARTLEERTEFLEHEIETGNVRWEAWRQRFETDWQRDRAEWQDERQKLQDAVDQWEALQDEDDVPREADSHLIMTGDSTNSPMADGRDVQASGTLLSDPSGHQRLRKRLRRAQRVNSPSNALRPSDAAGKNNSDATIDPNAMAFTNGRTPRWPWKAYRLPPSQYSEKRESRSSGWIWFRRVSLPTTVGIMVVSLAIYLVTQRN